MIATTLALAPAAHAGWDPPEPVAPTTNLTRIGLAPGGPGYVIGFPQAGSFRYAPRPIGGTIGAPLPLPGTSGLSFDGFLGFDDAGDMFVANTYPSGTGVLGFQPIGVIGAASQDMPAGHYPEVVSVAPGGRALVAAAPRPTGVIRVNIRPAGPGQTADLSIGGAQSFGSFTSTLVGALLQADDGALVVWQDGDTLYQAVRRSGQTSFDPPTAIADPRPDVHKFSVRLDGDSSGNAMLAWLGSTGGSARDQAVATVRTHDGTFGPAQVVGNVSAGGSIVNVTPATTSTGDGLVAWNHQYGGGGCQPSTVMGASFHASAFATQQPLGPSALPLTSIPGYPATVISAGDRLAVPLIEIDQGDTPCSYADDRRGLFYHHFRSGPGGLVDDGISELAPIPSKDTTSPPQPAVSEQAIEPGGRMLVSYTVGAAKYLRSFDGVPPGAAPPAPGPPPGPPTAPAPQKAIAIVPKLYVDPAALNPSKLEVSLLCRPEDIAPEECRGKAFAYYLFIGRYLGGKTAAKRKVKRKLIASGAGVVPSGKRGTIRLKLTAAGKALVARRKPAKIQLVVRIDRGSRTATGTFSTTLRALGRKRR